MRRLPLLAATLVLAAAPALAEFETRRSADDVALVTERLEQAARDAGAFIFARVDHADGAAGVDMRLPDAQLLIFGNPALGTQAMQDDIRAGLILPLRVLIYDDGGGTVLLWRDPDEMFDGLEIDDDAAYIDRIGEALDRLTDIAATGR